MLYSAVKFTTVVVQFSVVQCSVISTMQCSGQNNTVWAWWNVLFIALGYKEVEQSSSSSLWVFFLYLSKGMDIKHLVEIGILRDNH